MPSRQRRPKPNRKPKPEAKPAKKAEKKMSRPVKRLAAATYGRRAEVLLQRFTACVLFFVLSISFAGTASGQETQAGPPSVRSVSGQFIVSALPEDSPLLQRADLAADTNLVRLEPALLAVSVERFKLALWSRLGIRPGSSWSGHIFLTLYAPRTTNDEVNIEITPSPGAWSYRMQMPDIVTRTRYARALTGVLLLEIANRANRDASHSAELPPWLTDGLARQILGGESAKVILSAPSKRTDAVLLSLSDPTEKKAGLFLSRVDNKERGMDPLADARRTLQDFPALTFDELCWPSDAQMRRQRRRGRISPAPSCSWTACSAWRKGRKKCARCSTGSRAA